MLFTLKVNASFRAVTVALIFVVILLIANVVRQFLLYNRGGYSQAVKNVSILTCLLSAFIIIMNIGSHINSNIGVLPH